MLEFNLLFMSAGNTKNTIPLNLQNGNGIYLPIASTVNQM